MNGFFGAGLWSTDVNMDGIDDLLVGAPMYSSGIKPETGVVFVYLGRSDFVSFLYPIWHCMRTLNGHS